ncbi:MAG: hypothetical protein AMQ22_00028 [Candidatus Methanofastidiosum methylothiophilum]|uniref:Uncharacterized protein n=1 Tax=Candidatus Methanofastidiosum methylothiophilum TaxID=1705564 RepID=A0A150J9B8_9EURY|nr:MAG: hypothetical protein AMQ22_00028 [Candidatus Methanofastidiosum methylthiophilus]
MYSPTFFKTEDLNQIQRQILPGKRLKLRGHELSDFELRNLEFTRAEFIPLPEDMELKSQDKIFLEIDGEIAWEYQVLN